MDGFTKPGAVGGGAGGKMQARRTKRKSFGGP